MTSEPRGVDPNDSTEGTFELAAHRCFACGELSVHGLRMPLHIEPDHAWSEIVLDPSFQGWDGIAHGGILATLLDEGMAWAIAAREAFGFTARMAIEYRRPVPVGAPLRVDGRVLETRRRLIRAEADITDPATGEVYAHADGTYVTAPADRQAQLRGRYRFTGATDGPGGTRRWRVRQTLPPVESGAVEAARAGGPGVAGSDAARPGPWGPEGTSGAEGPSGPVSTDIPDSVASR